MLPRCLLCPNSKDILLDKKKSHLCWKLIQYENHCFKTRTQEEGWWHLQLLPAPQLLKKESNSCTNSFCNYLWLSIIGANWSFYRLTLELGGSIMGAVSSFAKPSDWELMVACIRFLPWVKMLVMLVCICWLLKKAPWPRLSVWALPVAVDFEGI